MHAPDLGRAVGRLSPLALAILFVTLILGTTGGAVAGALITGAQIKDGTVSSADIKNGSLTGTDIKDEARIFAATAGSTDDFALNDFTSDTPVSIVSKTITVPTAGYLFITGVVNTEADSSLGDDGNLYYGIKVDGKVASGDEFLDTNLEHFNLTGSVTAVVRVSKGTHTIKLIASDHASGSYVKQRSINAVWTAGGSRSGVYVDEAIRPSHRNAQR